MQKVVGVICLVLGLWFLWQGHNVAHSFGSEVTRTFTGEPLNKANHYYLAGIVSGLLGGFLIFWKRKEIK